MTDSVTPMMEIARKCAAKYWQTGDPGDEAAARSILSGDWDDQAYTQAALAALTAHALPGDVGMGWIVGNSDGAKWRTWVGGVPDWTDDRENATRYARRIDAEHVHTEDEEAWRVEPYAALSPPAAVI